MFLFAWEYPVFLTSATEAAVLFWANVLGTLTAFTLVGEALFLSLLINSIGLWAHTFVLMLVHYCLPHLGSLMSTTLFFFIITLVSVTRDSICVLGWIFFYSWKKNANKDFDRNCIGFVDHLGLQWHPNTIKSSYPYISVVFPIICAFFHFFQRHFVGAGI